MASIDCMKCTSGQAAGLGVHFDYEKRLELEHSNPHIDKSKTHLNSFYDCSGYPEMLHRQKKRVSDVDELHPPERVRKDRITAIMMEIPVPKSISDKGLTDQFLQDTYAMIGEMCGKANMCGMTIHRDEVHDYIDHGGAVRTSLEHGHAMVIPYARWTAKETVYGEDGKPLRDKNGKIVKQDVKREGVNAKHFLTRNFLKKLQDNMQAMVLDKYGISYQTSQEPLHMSVEDLKRDSARAAAIIERAEQQAAEAEKRMKVASQKAAAAFGAQQSAEQKAASALAEAAETQEWVEGVERCMQRQALEMMDKRDYLDTLDEKIRENEAAILRQSNVLNLIQNYTGYGEEADELESQLDTAEAITKELPEAAKPFRRSEADTFVQRMMTLLKSIRQLITVGIQRLQIFEALYNVAEKRSEPIQERAGSLDDKMSQAFAQASQSRPVGRQSADQPSGR